MIVHFQTSIWIEIKAQKI